MQDDEIIAAFTSLSEAMAAAKMADDEVKQTRKANDEAMQKHAQAMQLVEIRKTKIATLAARNFTPGLASVISESVKSVQPKTDLPNPRKK